MRLLALIAGLILAPPALAQSPFAGVWHGDLDVGAAQLRMELEVEEGEDGLSATLVSLDQGAARMLADSAITHEGVLSVSIDRPGVRITLTADGEDQLSGSFFQGQSFPLSLERGRYPSGFTMPDPYGADAEMTVMAGELVLAGSLRRPDGEGPFPGVLLLNGSGSQDRDATIAGRPVFAVLANALAERGIASLRLDDRGVGGSDAVHPLPPPIWRMMQQPLLKPCAPALTYRAAPESWVIPKAD